jgi:hypothetical protein
MRTLLVAALTVAPLLVAEGAKEPMKRLEDSAVVLLM